MQHYLPTRSDVLAQPKWSFSKGAKLGEVNSIVPGPGAYTTGHGETEAALKFKKSQGYSWGRGNRGGKFADATKDVGPGSYEINDLSRPTSVRGAGPRAPRGVGNKSTSFEPGPGSYNIPAKFGQGPKYSSQGKRMPNPRMNNPGPGAYNPNDSMSSAKALRGVASSASIGAKMGRGAREISYWHSKTPGPGAYETPDVKARAPQFSMRSGRRVMKQDETPGPGAHNTIYTLFPLND